jgi:toxin ParE1/3/4
VKPRKLRFSKDAVADIEQVLNHTLRRFGAIKHSQYKELIRKALAEIAANPSGWPAQQRPEIHRDARVFHIGRRGKPARHFFLYRIAGDEFVDIGRLLHDSMDIRLHSPDGFESGES